MLSFTYRLPCRDELRLIRMWLAHNLDRSTGLKYDGVRDPIRAASVLHGCGAFAPDFRKESDLSV